MNRKVYSVGTSVKATEADRMLNIGETTVVDGKTLRVVEVWYADNPKLRKPIFEVVR